MKLTFIKMIDNEPVFAGTYNQKPFQLLYVRTDIDYGWHFLDYLPSFSQQDAGTDLLDLFEQEDILESLIDINWKEKLETTE
jgi:hypothetical protein